MKKKIVFLVSNDLSFDQRMRKICTSLAASGFEIELVGRNRKNSIDLKPEPYKQTRLNLFFEKGKLFYVELNLRFIAYLLSRTFDGVCAIDLDTIVAAGIVARIKNKKLIYDAHEYFTEVPEVIRRPLVQKVWKWVENTFVPWSSLNYTVSETLADLFNKKYRINFEVIRNFPLYIAKRRDRSSKRPFQIIYQGALNEGRGLESLLIAMQEIDAHLTIAGDGDIASSLVTLSKKLQLEGKVTFTGLLHPDELKVLTAKSQIGINLLENKGLSYFYSLSNKFTDYVHAGIPQVCIAFPEYEKLNAQYQVAVLIKTIDPQEIKEAISRIVNDSKFYAVLEKNCEVCTAELNWQHEEKKLIAGYNELFR